MQNIKAYVFLVLCTLFWAGNFIVAKVATLFEIPPFTLNFYRWLIAFLILLPFTYKKIFEGFEEIKSKIVPLSINIKRLAEELVQIKSELIFSRTSFEIGIGNWKNTSILKDKVKLHTNLFLFREE